MPMNYFDKKLKKKFYFLRQEGTVLPKFSKKGLNFIKTYDPNELLRIKISSIQVIFSPNWAATDRR